MNDTLWLLTFATRCLCTGVLARSIELLWNWRELPDGRLLGWPPDDLPSSGLRQWSMRHPRALGVLAIRVGAALGGVVLPAAAPARSPLLAVLVLSQAYCNYRFDRVRQSADTMFLIGLGAAFVASLDEADESLRAVALTFLGSQALLAYFLAGADKLMTPSWRNGERLIDVLHNSANRVEPLGTLVGRYHALAVGMSWAVILLEILFPLCVVLPAPAFWSMLAAGVLFHAAIAVTMGLHSFLWSFVAAYPGIYHIHQWLAARLM